MRERDAKDARAQELLDPRLFDKIAECPYHELPRDPTTTTSHDHFLAKEGLAVYLPRRAGGGLCLVSSLDGMPVAMVQVYAVPTGEAHEHETSAAAWNELNGVPSTLIESSAMGRQSGSKQQFHAVFGSDDVELRVIFTNVSRNASLRITAWPCDAAGNSNESTDQSAFDSTLAPLESEEHVAERTTGRALLLKAVSKNASDLLNSDCGSGNQNGEGAPVDLAEELQMRVEKCVGSFLKISVKRVSDWYPSWTQAKWESLRWHSLVSHDLSFHPIILSRIHPSTHSFRTCSSRLGPPLGRQNHPRSVAAVPEMRPCSTSSSTSLLLLIRMRRHVEGADPPHHPLLLSGPRRLLRWARYVLMGLQLQRPLHRWERRQSLLPRSTHP